MSPLSDWLGVSAVEIRRQLLMAVLLGELLPLVAGLYLVAAFVWPGTLVDAPGWKTVLIVLLCGVALLMLAGALVVVGVAGRISTLSRTLRAINLPEVRLPGDDELTALARRLNALLKQQREKEMQVHRLEYALRRTRDEASGRTKAATDDRLRLARPYVSRPIFDLLLGLETARASRFHRSFSLAAVSFRPDDASIPEAVGNKAVRWVLGSLGDYVRDSDVGYRRSDSEVVFLLPETDQRQSVKFAHRLCTSVEAHPFVSGSRIGGVRVRVCCGLATHVVDGKEAEQLLEIAETRLSGARETGSGVVGST